MRFFYFYLRMSDFFCTFAGGTDDDQHKLEYMEPTKFDRAIKIVSLLIVVMAVIHEVWLIYQGTRGSRLIFSGMQYITLLLVIVPSMLKRRLNVEMPWMLFTIIVVFCFSGLILGDALNFYKMVPWWDDLLHIESGVLLAAIGLWLLRVALAANEKPIGFNRWVLAIYLVTFSLGMATFWECIEFTLDDLFGFNTQQFMATTKGSLITEADVPLCGHEALYDTMMDLSTTLFGAVPAAIYCFFRYDKVLGRSES